MNKARDLSVSNRLKYILLNYAIYFAGAIVILVFAFSHKAFFSVRNITGMFSNMAALLAAAGGMTIVIMAGELDLSIASIIMSSATFGASMMNNYGVEPHLGLLLMVLLGVVLGTVNALLVVGLKINPWMATLSMQLALRGFTLSLTDSATFMLPDSLKDYRNLKLFDFLPVLVLFVLVFLAILQYVIKATVFGRQLQAMGSNKASAANVGINTKRIRFIVYVISGFCAGVSGMLMSLNLASAAPFMGQNYEMFAIMAAVMGGASMLGGSGSILPGALFGVLFVQVLENGLSIMGVDIYVFSLIRGCLIFLAIYLDSVKNQLRIAA